MGDKEDETNYHLFVVDLSLAFIAMVLYIMMIVFLKGHNDDSYNNHAYVCCHAVPFQNLHGLSVF